VLRTAESVGFVVVAAFGHAFEIAFQLEAGSCRPVHGIGVIGVDQVDDGVAGQGRSNDKKQQCAVPSSSRTTRLSANLFVFHYFG
jgi:hypothetical protein